MPAVRSQRRRNSKTSGLEKGRRQSEQYKADLNDLERYVKANQSRKSANKTPNCKSLCLSIKGLISNFDYCSVSHSQNLSFTQRRQAWS